MSSRKRTSRWGQPGDANNNKVDDEVVEEVPPASDAPDPKKLAMEALARLGLLAPTPIAVPLGPAPTAHVPPPEPMDERSTEKMGINHMAGPKRYRLTKKATHDEVGQKFGVSVTVKGVFQAPEAPADPNNEPLHLEITGPSLTAVNAALHYLRDIAAEEEQASACVGKVYIGVPGSAPFNVVAKIVGTGGENLKHIKRTCNVQVTICGRDCRNAENESDEELHMKIEAKSSESLARATQLCEDLLAHVKDMYNEWLKTRPPPPPPPVVRAPPVIQPPVYAPQVLTPEQQQYMLYQQMYLQQMPNMANFAQYQSHPAPPPPPPISSPIAAPILSYTRAPPPPPPPPGVKKKNE